MKHYKTLKGTNWTEEDEDLILYRLGDLFYEMGEYNKTEFYYKKSIKIEKKILGEEHPDYAASMSDLGGMYSNIGQYKKAESYYKKSLEIYSKTLGEQHPYYATSLDNIGSLYSELGQYEKAESYFQQALEIYSKTLGEKHPDYATCLSNLGLFYHYIGQYEKAESHYKKASEAFGEESPDYAISQNNLGGIYSDMGQYEKAEPYYKQALVIQKKTLGEEHPNYATSLGNLGALYYTMGNFESAEKYHKQALEISKKVLGEEHPDYATSLNNLGSTYHAMDTLPTLVLAYYQQSLQVLKASFGESHRSIISNLKNLAFFHQSQNSSAKAHPFFQSIIQSSEAFLNTNFTHLGEKEREGLYNLIKGNFEVFTDFGFQQYQQNPELLSQILNLRLQHKAILLNTSNQIKNRILESGDRQLIDLYDELQEMKQQIGRYASLSKEELSNREINLDSLKDIMREKDQQLTQLSSFYAQETAKPKWQDIQAALQKGEAFVEIIRYRSYDYRYLKFKEQANYAALIVTPKTKEYPEVIFFGDGNFLEREAIDTYRNSIQYQIEDGESYQHFWESLQQILKKYNKVYISPDGVFNSLNISTLLDPKSGKYIQEEKEIHQLTTGKDLLQEKRNPLPQKLALLIGNPDFGSAIKEDSKQRKADFSELLANVERGAGIAPLPGTEKEVNSIRELLKEKGWREQTLTNNNAEEKALKKMLKPNILHIATHGFFQENVEGELNYTSNPLFRSGLLLSGAAKTLEAQQDIRGNTQMGKEDGILTAFEAMNLNIDNTDLVVLSACETGLGEIRNGEGVYGLQRAFKVAGARSILMSLWKVNDQTTQELMVSFYENWLGGMSKREAFNKAQLQLKEKYEHPYYWGAFVLIGE